MTTDHGAGEKDVSVVQLDAKTNDELRRTFTQMVHALNQERKDREKRTGKPEPAHRISYRLTSELTPEADFVSYVDAADPKVYHLYASDFWQSQRSVETPFWPDRLMPERYTATNGKRHPVRATKPAEGTILYKRFCPTFDEHFTLRAASIETDLAAFHAWHNEDRVDAFWGEKGDLAHHEAYLRRQIADPHVLPVFASFSSESAGEQVFAYFELYHCAEDVLATYADLGPHDRGFHIVVGGTAKHLRGPERVRVWLACVTHYLFLADCRTGKVVLEPRVDNAVLIAYLQRAGYGCEKEINFPHKRSALMTITREKFFESQGVET